MESRSVGPLLQPGGPMGMWLSAAGARRRGLMAAAGECPNKRCYYANRENVCCCSVVA